MADLNVYNVIGQPDIAGVQTKIMESQFPAAAQKTKSRSVIYSNMFDRCRAVLRKMIFWKTWKSF